jgi:hypothetical protein
MRFCEISTWRHAHQASIFQQLRALLATDSAAAKRLSKKCVNLVKMRQKCVKMRQKCVKMRLNDLLFNPINLTLVPLFRAIFTNLL